VRKRFCADTSPHVAIHRYRGDAAIVHHLRALLQRVESRMEVLRTMMVTLREGTMVSTLPGKTIVMYVATASGTNGKTFYSINSYL